MRVEVCSTPDRGVEPKAQIRVLINFEPKVLAIKGEQILDALKCKFQHGCMHKFTRSITILKWPLAF